MEISVSTGVEEIEIKRNGERAGAIRFSLSDPALLVRLRKVSAEAERSQRESRLGDLKDDLDAALAEAQRVDGEIRKMLDDCFLAPVSETVFGDSFSFTTFEGKTLVEQFLEGVTPHIERCFKAEMKAAEKRQKKYLEKYGK